MGSMRSGIIVFGRTGIVEINCAGSKQKSCKIMRMNMFAAYDKVKPDIENIKGLNLAVVKLRPFN
jgi:hypothetical protein